MLTGAASVKVTCYLYRRGSIPVPVDPETAGRAERLSCADLTYVPHDEDSAQRLDYQLSQCVNFWIGSRYAGLKSSRYGYATAIIAACCTSA